MFDACLADEEKRISGKIKKKVGYYYEFPFYNAFKKYTILRKSCYQCKYVGSERYSDITLADFWGIEKINHKYNVNDGVSMLIVNTEIGREG